MVAASVNLIPEAPLADLVSIARRAEELGFTGCWVYDEGLATRDVYITLAAIVGATSTLRVGTGITNPYTRHPATTAATTATLDELSNGRAFLGIGAGGSLTLDPLGLERKNPVGTVRAVMEACRRLMDGETVTMSGPGFELVDAHLGFPTRRGIEIWLAGRGPKMLALGGALADGVMLDFIHKPSLGTYVSLVRNAGPSHRPAARICYSTMVITDQRAMEETRPHMTYRLVDSPPEVKKAIGLSEADADRIRRAMAGGLLAAAEHVRDEWVLPFVISGSIDECATELGNLVDRHDIDEFLLPILDHHGAHHLIESVSQVVARV
jgi:5,10-methylenetetrahydromethanopterin reductase